MDSPANGPGSGSPIVTVLSMTGSPAGNGTHYNRYLRHDDIVDSAIDGLGVQRNRCVADSRA